MVRPALPHPMARQSNAARRKQRQEELERERHAEAKKKRIRTTLAVGGIVVALALVAFATWPESAVGNTSREAWDLPQLDGDGRVKLADFRGKPTVAAFFANWCTECEWEMPELLELSRQIGEDVNFVGIDMMDNGRGLGDAEKWGVAGEWPLARDIGNGNGSSLAALSFGARGSPLHVIYDAEGRVVDVTNGATGASGVLNTLRANGLIDG